MSTTLAPLPIRLFCDLAARMQTLVDLNTGLPPMFVRGDDVEIDIGIGQAGTLLAPPLGNVASVTCQVYSSENATTAPLMSCVVPVANMNLGLTAAEWTGVAAPYFHAAFVFPNAQTGISLGGAPSVNYWLHVTLQTGDAPAKNITLAAGLITIYDGPATVASPSLYTLGLSSAPGVPTILLGTPSLPAFTGNARLFTVNGTQVWQVKNSSDGLFYTIMVETVNGVATLALSDTGYE